MLAPKLVTGLSRVNAVCRLLLQTLAVVTISWLSHASDCLSTPRTSKQ